MQLTDDQKKTVAEWVRNGASLSDVQRRLTAELGVSMTFMDVRFLVIELGVAVQDKRVTKPAVASPLGGAPEEGAFPAAGEDADAPLAGGPLAGPDALGGGAVSVELDRIVKPGSIVSGSVTFSDGVTAAWALDQMGRLSLSAPRPGYSPPPEDIPVFQQELRQALERRGF